MASNRRTLAETLHKTLDLQTPTEPSRLSFLGLPAELRLRIYDFLPAPAFPSAARQQEQHDRVPASKSETAAASSENHFAVLHTNRQIYREARPILYANIAVSTTWLQELPPHARPAIRTVRVLCHFDPGYGAGQKGKWKCEPAIKPLSGRARGWTLENLWRFLGRSWGRVREVQVGVAVEGLSDLREEKVAGGGGGQAGVSSEGGERRDVGVLLPKLECVVIDLRPLVEVVGSEKGVDVVPLVEMLRMEVGRLSPGVLVVEEGGAWW